MWPMNGRRRAWILSAIAGGGLTAGLAAPLSGALGAGTHTTFEPASTTPSTPTTGTQWESTETTSSAQTQTTSPPATTTPTTGTGSSTSTTPPPATTTTPKPAAPAAEAPKVKLQRKQRPTEGGPNTKAGSNASKTTSATPGGAAKSLKATGANNVALPPQLAAGQAAAIAAALASSSASVQALGFYRIPLFLLPIYKAAAVQYGVPWQILAAINEIETNFGTDQSVSTAGAVGWMQFMPATWLQYGVDALNAGYADPYNPVDAIFAAARYLRAAGAEKNLSAAIFAYNHSQEYVDSVLLRAKLISSYPKGVIATLTGLIDGRLPVTGKHVAWTAVAGSHSSATAAAVPAPATAASAKAAPSPVQAAAEAAGAKQPLQLDELSSATDAQVVAVQAGRVAKIGHSSSLGEFIVLRDVYGDEFTYAGLGSLARTYAPAKPAASRVTSTAVEIASGRDPAPSQAASAGRQPLTLQVKPQSSHTASSGHTVVQGEASVTGGKVRLFANPGNPDAVAAAAKVRSAHRAASSRLPLRTGAVVPSGTTLGTVHVTSGAPHGHIRFGIKPAGDAATIDPGPVLANWAQLGAALHPQGAKAQNPLLGATASDVFLMSQAQLERAVLADPGIVLDACGRHDVSSGKLDKRSLAVLAFLSRSGLTPTVGGLRCGLGGAATAIDITAINGTAVARHQGSGTITDLTIRTLLTMPAGFVPEHIISLMRYPSAPNTQADAGFANRIHLVFAKAAPAVTPKAANATSASRAFNASQLATPYVSATQWNQLMSRIGALPEPLVVTKPSAAAIPDPKHK
jgi:hypothetical protein